MGFTIRKCSSEPPDGKKVAIVVDHGEIIDRIQKINDLLPRIPKKDAEELIAVMASADVEFSEGESCPHRMVLHARLGKAVDILIEVMRLERWH